MTEPTPAAILVEEADRIDATRAQFPIAVQNGITWATAELRRRAAEPRRVADETAATETQPTDAEESPAEAARRFARRLAAVERLCGGHPGYHTVTVKALLTAMSEADESAVGAEQDEAADAETQAVEDPARIDRLRPELFEHASVEAIDAQIQRAQRQQRAWGNRERSLTILRQARVTQKESGEWPAGAQPVACPPGCVACATDESHDPMCLCTHPKSQHGMVSGRLLCGTCDPDSTDHLVCREFEAL
ncbi:hypothetical protein [Streptomyces sp. AD55]|uniref:hypothetical protein n=1 Tax=Streptomyces sp. AD55 TaxID=3242895 RepID=UPI003529275F